MRGHPNAFMRNGQRWFEIPPGSKGNSCRDCGILVYWISSGGKRLPIDPNVSGAYSARPATESRPAKAGFGVLHFDVCRKRHGR